MPAPCEKWTVRDLINQFVGGGHIDEVTPSAGASPLAKLAAFIGREV